MSEFINLGKAFATENTESTEKTSFGEAQNQLVATVTVITHQVSGQTTKNLLHLCDLCGLNYGFLG